MYVLTYLLTYLKSAGHTESGASVKTWRISQFLFLFQDVVKLRIVITGQQAKSTTHLQISADDASSARGTVVQAALLRVNASIPHALFAPNAAQQTVIPLLTFI